MAEVRVAMEGTLGWVQQSGSGTSWATASAALSGANMAYVRGFSYNSGLRTVQVANRGIPDHNKVVGKDAINGSFSVAYANTADMPTKLSATCAGASVMMIMLEARMKIPEVALSAGSGIYYQFYGIAPVSCAFAEGDNENTMAFNFIALGMNGPTASGYLG